jgi:hypothetical protein
VTNYQTAVIDEIKTRLKTITDIGLVGEYPENQPGTNYPVALVFDGDEDFEFFSGDKIKSIWQVSIFTSQKVAINRLEKANDFQVDIITKVLDGNDLDGTVSKLTLLSVEKGEYSKDLDLLDVGYSDTLINRMINFEVEVCNAY